MANCKQICLTNDAELAMFYILLDCVALRYIEEEVAYSKSKCHQTKIPSAIAIHLFKSGKIVGLRKYFVAHDFSSVKCTGNSSTSADCEVTRSKVGFIVVQVQQLIVQGLMTKFKNYC